MGRSGYPLDFLRLGSVLEKGRTNPKGTPGGGRGEGLLKVMQHAVHLSHFTDKKRVAWKSDLSRVTQQVVTPCEV